MTPLGRFILATLCGLVLAGLVHIATVLAIPYLAAGDAMARARATLPSTSIPAAIDTIGVSTAAKNGARMNPNPSELGPVAGTFNNALSPSPTP